MSAFATLTDLAWTAADGTSLFSGLTLGFGAERTGLVGRNGSGKTTLLRLIAGEIAPGSGQVHVSGRVGLMRQDTGGRAGATIADLFGARTALELIDRAARGCAAPEELLTADWTLPARIGAALLRVGLAAGPETALASLSGGQRTRARLAALVFGEPEMLLLDEPTNDLDTEGRAAVAELLRSWRGAAVVVSHDRELLAEMDAIVELTSLGARRYGGNYAAYHMAKEDELRAARRDLADAGKARDRAAERAQEAAERKARRDGAGKRGRARGGQPAILMDAARGRAEASGGASSRLRDRRRTEAEAALTVARERIERIEPIDMAIAPTGLLPGRCALRLEAVTGGPDPAHPVIRDLSLTVTGPERIAVTGPNGSGKSTLLGLITGRIAPGAGRIETPVPMALLDQRVSLLDPAKTLRDNFLTLNPGADANHAHAVLARFRFRAADALRLAGALSGGERLRAGLACTLGGTPPPPLLLLDEPTNHLDLDGVAALEAALAAYDGALIVVSHDAAFLSGLGLTRRLHLSG